VAQYFEIHPVNPQPRLLRQAAEIVRRGGLIAYPTDSSYALGCPIGDADAVQRLRRVRGVDDKHHLTLMCRDLSEIGTYAIVDNRQYRLLKSLTPGSYTFILQATREVPKRLQHPKRKTIGVRVPDNAVALGLLEELGEPMLSSTLILPGADAPLADADEVREALERQIDLVVDGGYCGTEPTTVVDLSGEVPTVVREGRGDVSRIGRQDAV